MPKKDMEQSGENIDRGNVDAEEVSNNDDPVNNNTAAEGETSKQTHVKNASAAGLGTIGRNDQKQTGLEPKHSQVIENDN